VNWNDGEKCYYFLEVHGEPGHSGALMRRSAKPFESIGVYFGIAPGAKGKRFRGIIVPVPDRKNLHRLKPCAPQTKAGKRYCKKKSGQWLYYEEEGDHYSIENYPGVFVPGRVPLKGSGVFGSCRCH